MSEESIGNIAKSNIFLAPTFVSPDVNFTDFNLYLQKSYIYIYIYIYIHIYIYIFLSH